MTSLSARSCVACRGDTPRFTAEEIAKHLEFIEGWEVLAGGTRIQKAFTFKNFKEAMRFLNWLAMVSEAENHHPDFSLQRYKEVTISFTTQAIGGLSINDFVMAAKVDQHIAGMK